jgi:sulfate adenylyltransferase subunit 2
MGKDSTALLQLARKAFWPSRLPFPLLHVDTTWEFREMYAFREKVASQNDVDMLIHVNEEGLARGVNPFDFTPSTYTSVMKTEALRQALDKYRFDAAFGGSRRDEEASRAKERIFSFRSEEHRWDPRNQRPEMWRLLNGRLAAGQSARVFPLSNWTERDVWCYIAREGLEVVPLYLAADRPTLLRENQLLVPDGEGLSLRDNESIVTRRVRFRTLGCWPNTAAEQSDASDVSAVIAELIQARKSERAGRLIDHDEQGAMEKKKQEGYF